MKNSITLSSLIFICLSLAACNITAQTKENTYSVKGWWASAQPPFSPVVHADRTITFRVKAPSAKQVDLLFGEWDIKPVPLIKDTSGIWSGTIGPVEPEIYAYNFSIDGINTIDMENPDVKTGTMVYSSIVEVKGNTPRFDEVQDVPHGTMQILNFKSTPMNKLRSLYVYLPNEYMTEPGREFPVLYLRHGGGDNESNWSEDGKAGVILENLISNKKAVPMIIVMTNGMTDGSWAGGSSPEGMALLEDELLTDVIPLVEKSFHVIKNKENRAIAGLSMGGGQAFIMGLKNLDKFSWIGEFSSGLLSDYEFDLEKRIPGISNAEVVNSHLKLLWISCGTLDPRYNGHLNLVESLKKRGIKNEFTKFIGGHEWKVWRHSLYEFLQKIFINN